jgi:hypothetical protein
LFPKMAPIPKKTMEKWKWRLELPLLPVTRNRNP